MTSPMEMLTLRPEVDSDQDATDSELGEADSPSLPVL
jgi:hypothetical protein